MVVHGTIANNMPELPEVTTIVGILNNIVDGKTIKSVDVLRNQTIESDVKEFINILPGKTINNITRIGKFIIFHLSDNFVMISHLRMEGKYFLKQENEKIEKHDLIIFHFTDNTFLAYNDTRRFGRISLSKEENYLSEKPICQVGPDPFMLKNAERLEKAFKKKSIAIKTCLLDQTVMSGLGNIYVDEVLFKTKIHPETPAKLVTKKQLEEILISSREVLQKAIDAGGSTIKSYHPQEGVSGNFQVQLQVYGKGGKPCPVCGTKLKKIFVNGRGTTFCPNCQNNKTKPYILGLTGPIASGKSVIGKYLETKGFIRIDADEVVHYLYKQKNIQDNVLSLFPTLTIINGEINRDNLKDLLINNPMRKERFEKLVWSFTKEEIKNRLSKLSNNDKVVLEIPLLFASGLDLLCDDIIIVKVDKNINIERLKKRNLDYAKYLELNKSYYLQEDTKKATKIIVNNDDVASLYKTIDNFIYDK